MHFEVVVVPWWYWCVVVLLRSSVAVSTVGRLLIGVKRFSRTTICVAGQFSGLKTVCALIFLN
jgi:hypothetical protein